MHKLKQHICRARHVVTVEVVVIKEVVVSDDVVTVCDVLVSVLDDVVSVVVDVDEVEVDVELKEDDVEVVMVCVEEVLVVCVAVVVVVVGTWHTTSMSSPAPRQQQSPQHGQHNTRAGRGVEGFALWPQTCCNKVQIKEQNLLQCGTAANVSKANLGKSSQDIRHDLGTSKELDI